jgi:hypothetical protein
LGPIPISKSRRSFATSAKSMTEKSIKTSSGRSDNFYYIMRHFLDHGHALKGADNGTSEEFCG